LSVKLVGESVAGPGERAKNRYPLRGVVCAVEEIDVTRKHMARSPGNSSRLMAIASVFVFAALALIAACAPVGEPRPTAAVPEKVSHPGRYQGYSSPAYDGVRYRSFYLPMRDGVRIATDLYLPADLPEEAKLPTILYQTRYIRAMEYRWPFRMFAEPSRQHRTIEHFVRHGYAWVSIDARGSGASFGTRPHPWSPDEVADGAELVEWIIQQPWSDGQVGAFGTSYTGTTSEFLLVNRHPAVKAAAPRFALFDAYTDIAFPGGVHQNWFTKKWAAGNVAIDTNTITDKFGPRVRMMVRGIRPVDADPDRSMLAAAIRDHEKNYNVHEEALEMEFRDDVAPSGYGTTDTFSPHRFTPDVQASGAAVYSYSGWYDGAYQHAAIKRYMTLANPGRLTIGPWDHGGRQQISPWRSSPVPEFDHDAEMLRFFDHHLKGIPNGIMEEKPVHYFTMGEEKWKADDEWPPEHEVRTFFFAADGGLATARPTDASGEDSYVVDYEAGTGDAARWNSLTGPRTGILFGYPDRKEQDEKLLTYTSAPLQEDMEVTGHPVVRLFVSSTASDGNFFAYLEEVAFSGEVIYVTEGQLRAVHRKLSEEERPYQGVAPHRSFEKQDAMPLVPGEVAELVFDLLPTSYLFKKGSSVRVALAGADKDHFALMKQEPAPTLAFHRNRVHASAIELPVVSRSPAVPGRAKRGNEP
jgi:putative CocE/NonD family hydrolase